MCIKFSVGKKNLQHQLVLSLSQISERWFQADSMPPQSSVSCSWPGLLRLLLHSPVPVFLVCLCFPVWPLLFLHVSHLPVFSSMSTPHIVLFLLWANSEKKSFNIWGGIQMSLTWKQMLVLLNTVQFEVARGLKSSQVLKVDIKTWLVLNACLDVIFFLMPV